MIKSICVYCGSSPGATPVYAEGAKALARAMVERDIALVYGGGNVGLMGVIATEALRLGGKVTGVIPTALMANMHERKAMMAELADGFIAMPGGMGTMEELFEVLTWAQLGFHAKPIGLLNTGGFYDSLLAFVRQMVTERFLTAEQSQLMMSESAPDALLERFIQFKPTYTSKWLDRAAARNLLP